MVWREDRWVLTCLPLSGCVSTYIMWGLSALCLMLLRFHGSASSFFQNENFEKRGKGARTRPDFYTSFDLCKVTRDQGRSKKAASRQR